MGKIWCFISTDRYSSEFILFDGSLTFEDVRDEILKEFNGLSNCCWNKTVHTEESYYTRLTPHDLYEIKTINIRNKTNG